MTELLFKIIIIGDPAVGKTSFVQRYVNDSYRRDYKMTIGGKFKSLPSKIMNIHVHT
jgi:Ras-related protein Rab-7L1